MNFMPIDSMGDTSSLMDIIAKRQKALGENLANVDTPGYVRKDVDFGQVLNSTGASSLETQLSAKFGHPSMIEERNGESVNSANELMEIQKNSLLYTMATRRMSNIITEMKTVINVGK